jgi:hypothetical protein
MAQPFNYMLSATDPTDAVTSGLQQGVQLASMMERADLLAAQRRQTDLENAALRAKAQMLADQQAAVKAFYETPSEKRTAADYERLTATLPKEQADNIRAGFEAKTKEQQKQELLFGGQVFAALRNKDTGTASQMLIQKADAFEAAGDKAQAQAYRNAADMSLIAPDQAELFVGTTLSALPGGKEFISNIGAQQEQRQKEALFKPELAKKEAEAAIEGIKQKYMDEGERARIDLLKAQAGQAKAAAYKSSREASEVGKLTPEKKFKFEEDLRERYEKNSKEFKQINQAYTGIKATGGADASPVNRVAKVFAFVKMIDPGSVVRDGDFEALRNTRGFAMSPDWFKQEVDRVATGAPIKDDTVKQINAAATDIYKAARERDTTTRDTIKRIAKDYNLDESQLFISRQEQTPEEEAAARAPRATRAAPAMSTAAPAVSGGGSWAIASVRQ